MGLVDPLPITVLDLFSSYCINYTFAGNTTNGSFFVRQNYTLN